MKKKEEKEFKAVDFMRKVRAEMSQRYLTNRVQYLAELDEMSKNFIRLRKKNTLLLTHNSQ